MLRLRLRLRVSRRAFLRALGAGLVGLGAAGISRLLSAQAQGRPELPPAKRGLPERQHAWDAFLRRDRWSNAVPPRFHRLIFFDVEGDPTPEKARRLEAALRALEHLYGWGPEGLLFVVGWGPRYFERLGLEPPIERPRPLTAFETPALDDFEGVLHLASDDEGRLARIERALWGEEGLPGDDGLLSLEGVLRRRETRTGFIGEGLPHERQAVGGLPETRPVPPEAPMFTGFPSGFRKNQASEDDVTIPDGPFAGGTTMQISRKRLRLEGWYELLTEEERVARMFAPQMRPEAVRALTDEAPTFSERFEEAATKYGVVGHLQAVGRARRGGKPLLLRRDFNTTDGGQAGLHFVSLQRSIRDFVETRRAMTAAEAPFLNPAIGPRVNNGIKEFFFVLNRANFLVPPRRQRALPALPGREDALEL